MRGTLHYRMVGPGSTWAIGRFDGDAVRIEYLAGSQRLVWIGGRAFNTIVEQEQPKALRSRRWRQRL